MKKILLILSLTTASLWAQVPPPAGAVPPPGLQAPDTEAATTTPATADAAKPVEKGFITITPSSTANLTEAELNKVYAKSEINFKGMPIDDFLNIYAEFVKRTVLRSGAMPNQTVTIANQTPLTGREVIQLLNAVLAINGIGVINVDSKFVKVMPLADVGGGAQPIESGTGASLPELGQYTTHVVQLKYLKPAEVMPIIAPFAKIPNSILPIEGNNILVIRDFAENVKRMLEMIGRIDVAVDSEFECEVIPIKYALAGDINSALNSLSGGGGGGSIGGGGTSGGSTRSSGGSRGGRAGGSRLGGGMGGQGGQYPGQGGQQPAGGLGAAGGGGTFTDRLKQIVQKAAGPTGGSGDFSIIGMTKIIADERTNSLLVYASREDMKTIKEVIAKLDVVLAQVMIESIILGVNGNSAFDFGVSAAQNPAKLGNNITGGGVVNNDKDLLGTGAQWFQNLVTSNALSAIPKSGGLAYFGAIGTDWNVALTALASDGKTEVIQKPIIMTTHAKRGEFFVGDTVPYVTSTYYGGGFGGGPSSSYQQLRVGIELGVTPFINPDGIVVMEIDQAIEEVSGSSEISGVGKVPTTASRTLHADVTVRDRDTIVLGGFMRSSGQKSKSGVPLLKDIPLLGGLFRSTSNSKDRKELVVLMRPTVLATPELAAIAGEKERQRMPGINRFERRLQKEEDDFQKKMDKLDGIKKPKAASPAAVPAPAPAPATSKAGDQHAELMRRATAQKNVQPDSDIMHAEAAIVAGRQNKAVEEALTGQPAGSTQPESEWAKPPAKSASKPFKTVQPMTEDEKKMFGRTTPAE